MTSKGFNRYSNLLVKVLARRWLWTVSLHCKMSDLIIWILMKHFCCAASRSKQLVKLRPVKMDVVQRLNLDWVWKAQTNVSAWAEFYYWSRQIHYFLIIYYLNDKYVFLHILKCINHSSIWHEFRIVSCDISSKWKLPCAQDTNS